MSNEKNTYTADGLKIRRLRKKAKLTQDALAEKSGLDRGTIQNAEKGKDMYPINLERIAKVFELEIEDIAVLPEDKPSSHSREQLESYYESYGDFIEGRIQGFVGRDFVFDAIDEFINKNDRGYFFVEGDPGIGKSALAAQLVKDKGYIHHFNVRSDGRNKAHTFLANICSRLIVKYKLDYQDLPSEALEDNAFLSQLLSEISGKVGPKQKIVIMVDALDEVDMDSLRAGANVLYLPSDLPKKIFFIATKRKENLSLNIRCKQKYFEIDHSSDENKEDIEKYLVANTSNSKIRSYILKHELDRESFIETMKEKSDGNFMYLYYVLREIKDGCYIDTSPENLPHGLRNYYRDHWCRMGMMAEVLPAAKIRIIYVLCEAIKPASRTFIADVLQEDEILVQKVIDEWISFLHKHKTSTKPQYSLYHDSFRDFLKEKDIVKAACINTGNINELMGDYLYKEWFKNSEAESAL